MEFIVTNIWWVLFFITLAFIFSYKRITKKPDAITSKFEACKKINGSPNDNLEIIMKAMKRSGFRKAGHDERNNRFYAQTRFSMSSFSEYIEVTYTHDHTTTNLKFKSICAYPAQIFDWGKNKRNFKRFEKELDKLIQRP